MYEKGVELLIRVLTEAGGKPEGATWRELADIYFQGSLSPKQTQDVWRTHLRRTLRNESAQVTKDTSCSEQEPKECYKGKLKSTWQTQGKGGKVITLHSYKHDDGVEDFEELQKDLLNDFERIVKTVPKPLQNTSMKAVEDSVPKALFIHTSDKHVGAMTKMSSSYSNYYDPNILEGRMWDILRGIREQVELYGKFEKLVVTDLGDTLDGYNGSTSRGGRLLPQNLDNREQFDTYVAIHKAFFDELHQMDAADSIDVIMLSNCNHASSFGYTAQRALQMYLEHVLNINCRVAIEFIDRYTYGYHEFIFTHGKDEEDMKHGWPRILDMKTEAYVLGFLRHYDIGTKAPKDGLYTHVIKGDLHISNTEYGKNFRYKNIPSVYGGSKWIHTNFGPTLPAYCMEVISKWTPEVVEMTRYL